MGRLMRLGAGAGRWTSWGRVIAAAEILLLLKRHVDNLRPGELAELRRLLGRSKGRPGNLSAAERGRVRELVRRLELGPLAREAGSKAVPFVRRK